MNTKMTIKEEAKELLGKFSIEFQEYGIGNVWTKKSAKKQALISVDEKIKLIKELLDKSTEIYQSLSTPKKLCTDILNPILKELEEVKQEAKIKAAIWAGKILAKRYPSISPLKAEEWTELDDLIQYPDKNPTRKSELLQRVLAAKTN